MAGTVHPTGEAVDEGKVVYVNTAGGGDFTSIQDAVNKVARMYPKAKLLGVERVSQSGREYETTWVNR